MQRHCDRRRIFDDPPVGEFRKPNVSYGSRAGCRDGGTMSRDSFADTVIMTNVRSHGLNAKWATLIKAGIKSSWNPGPTERIVLVWRTLAKKNR